MSKYISGQAIVDGYHIRGHELFELVKEGLQPHNQITAKPIPPPDIVVLQKDLGENRHKHNLLRQSLSKITQKVRSQLLALSYVEYITLEHFGLPFEVATALEKTTNNQEKGLLQIFDEFLSTRLELYNSGQIENEDKCNLPQIGDRDIYQMYLDATTGRGRRLSRLFYRPTRPQIQEYLANLSEHELVEGVKGPIPRMVDLYYLAEADSYQKRLAKGSNPNRLQPIGDGDYIYGKYDEELEHLRTDADKALSPKRIFLPDKSGLHQLERIITSREKLSQPDIYSWKSYNLPDSGSGTKEVMQILLFADFIKEAVVRALGPINVPASDQEGTAKEAKATGRSATNQANPEEFLKNLRVSKKDNETVSIQVTGKEKGFYSYGAMSFRGAETKEWKTFLDIIQQPDSYELGTAYKYHNEGSGIKKRLPASDYGKKRQILREIDKKVKMFLEKEFKIQIPDDTHIYYKKEKGRPYKLKFKLGTEIDAVDVDAKEEEIMGMIKEFSLRSETRILTSDEKITFAKYVEIARNRAYMTPEAIQDLYDPT